MAKISALPRLGAPTGAELVPVLAGDGTTRVADIGGLVDRAVGQAGVTFANDGALQAGGRWLADAAPPIAASQAFARYGYGLVAQISAGAERQFICDIPGNMARNAYVAVSLLVSSSVAGAFPPADASGLRVILNWDGVQEEFAPLAYDELSTTQRRYHGVLRVAGARASNLLFQVKNSAPSGAALEVTAFLASASDYRIVDVDWRAVQTQRSTDLPATAPGRPRPCGGNLPGGQFAYAFGASADYGAVVAFPDQQLGDLGIEYALRLNAGQTCFWSPSTMPVCPIGKRVVRSLILVKSGPGAWPTGDDLRVVLYETASFGGASQSVSIASLGRFTPLADGRRRYWVAFDATIRARRALVQVSGAAAGTTFFVTGFAEGEFDYPATDLAWRDWDLAAERDHGQRIAAIEERLGTATQPTDPALMLASSYDVIAGRPLLLHRDGFTAHREASDFEVTAIGRNGDRVGMATAAPIMELRAETFVGKTLIRAKRKGIDGYDAFGAEATIYNAPAARSGSPTILLFGDSLPYQYQTAELARKLKAIGMTPTFVGSYPAHGNYDGTAASGDPAFIPAEARSSFQAVNVDYRVRRAQENGTFFDLFPVRDDGGQGATFAATIAGGKVTALQITAAGTGYPAGRIPLLIASPATSDTNRRALGWVTFADGKATQIELEYAGSGYVTAPAVNLIPTIAEYSALPATNDFDERWRFLPWLRLATASDDPATVHNGYRVDIAWYLQRLGIAAPDLVVIGWETNDIRQGTSAADTLASLRNFTNAVRAALPNAHILLTVNGMGEKVTLWPGVCAIWKALFPVYGGKEDARLWLRPLFQAMDPKLVYGMTTTATDPATGIRTLSIADSVHPLRVGASLAAEMLAAWVACR